MNVDFVIEELQRLPRVVVERTPEADRLLLHVAGRTVPLNIVTRSNGFPRDVREAVRQAESSCQDRQETILVCTPALTSSSRTWLQQERIAYLDGQGNLFLTADGIYLFREPSVTAARSRVPAETDIFRGRAVQALQALLHTPERSWHVTELAAEAEVAPGTALRVCATLEAMLLMERTGSGPHSLRRLLKPGDLLTEWATRQRLAAYSSHRYYRWMQNLDALAISIGEAAERQGAPYAATLTFGALHRAPFITHTEVLALLIPLRTDVKQLAADCRLDPADEGYNVLLLATRTDGPLMYRQKSDDLWIANDIQLYLDLFASPGRGRDQAEHLRRERIGF